MSTHGSAIQTTTDVHVYVVIRLLVVGIGTTLLMLWIFGFFWGIVLTLLAFAAMRPKFHKNIGPFNAGIVLDGSTKTIRVIHTGLNWIAPGEKIQSRINLRKDVHELSTPQTWSSGAGNMTGTYLYSLSPDVSSSDALITYASFLGPNGETDAIEKAAHSVINTILSTYYYNKRGDNKLRNVTEINKLLFASDESGFTNPEIREFEKNHGCRVRELRLEDVDFDKKVQDYRDSLVGITTIEKATKKLVKTGLDITEAARIARLAILENVHENIWTVNAKGLENLHDVTMMGGIGTTPKGGGKK